MIRGLWYQQADSIIDVKLDDAETDSYKYEPMAACLALWETIKKDNHGKHCNNQKKHSSLFVISLDRILGKGSPGRTCKIESHHGEKNDEPLSNVQRWVNS